MCADSDNFISNFHAPRGRAGVAILWPMELTKYIKRLPVGNTRIIAIEISTNEGNVCLINCYMPSMDSGSTAQYIEHLDVLQSIIDKYIVSHRLVVCGDFNGTLMSSRSNQHDRLLRTFCEKNSLTDSLGGSTKCTFFHHSGNSSSQIDYILTKSGCTFGNLVSIFDMQDINTVQPVLSKRPRETLKSLA